MAGLIEDLRERNATGQDAARELGRGLMRGNRAEFKLGYSWENAAHAAADMFSLEGDDVAELRVYLLGFAVGMQPGTDEVGEAVLRHRLGADEYRAAYETGKDRGRAEVVGVTYPAGELETAADRAERLRAEARTMGKCGCGATTKGECCAAVEGYFTSLGQRPGEELRSLAEGDGCEAARVMLVERSQRTDEDRT